MKMTLVGIIVSLIGYIGVHRIGFEMNVWDVICEDSEGPYIMSYASPERYDYIEEVHLCEPDA